MIEPTYIVTRTRNVRTEPPIMPASVTFRMPRPKVTTTTNLCRMVIMAGLAYYDQGAEYIVTEVTPMDEGGAHTQTWYFSNDRFYSQS